MPTKYKLLMIWAQDRKGATEWGAGAVAALGSRGAEVPYLKSEQRSLLPVKSGEGKKKCGLTLSHKASYIGSHPCRRS